MFICSILGAQVIKASLPRLECCQRTAARKTPVTSHGTESWQDSTKISPSRATVCIRRKLPQQNFHNKIWEFLGRGHLCCKTHQKVWNSCLKSRDKPGSKWNFLLCYGFGPSVQNIARVILLKASRPKHRMGEEVGIEEIVIDVEAWAEQTEHNRLARIVAAAGGIERIAHLQTREEADTAERLFEVRRRAEAKAKPKPKPIARRALVSEECQKPQPPLLLKKVSQYASHLYCNTPPICIAGLLVPLGSKEREKCQYSSHLYRSTPPICIAIRLPFVSQYFWENLGGCGHRDVPHCRRP